MRISDWSSDVCSSDLPVSGSLSSGLGASAGAPHPAVGELRVREAYQSAKFAVFDAVLQQMEERGQMAEALSPKLLRAGIERAIARFNLGEGLALNAQRSEERSVGKSVSVRVDLGGRRIL